MIITHKHNSSELITTF